MVRAVIDVDAAGNARPLVVSCECRNWSGTAEWCDAAIRDSLLHHPSCELWDPTRYAQAVARLGDDPEAQGKFGDALKRSKFAKDLVGAAGSLVDALNGAVRWFWTAGLPQVAAGYALYKLAGPATTYAASRAGAKAGATRKRRRRARHGR